MSASKKRPRWSDLPAAVRAQIEQLLAGQVVAAENCAGGFSPGFASRLALAGGRRAFVKAMDAGAWPAQAGLHRAEAAVAAALPAAVPAPRFLGSRDDGRWVILAFECVDGAEPAQPWRAADLDRAVAALAGLHQSATPLPVTLPRDHPRLGGWAQVAADAARRARLPAHSPWAAARLPFLVALEGAGRAAAQGSSLVHFDLYRHNILLTPGRVVFIDWPHARRGAPIIDLLTLLSSAAADGLDPEPFLRRQTLAAQAGPHAIDAVLAAQAGFCLADGLDPPTAGLEPVYAAKLDLGLRTIRWLQRRLSGAPHVSRPA